MCSSFVSLQSSLCRAWYTSLSPQPCPAVICTLPACMTHAVEILRLMEDAFRAWARTSEPSSSIEAKGWKYTFAHALRVAYLNNKAALPQWITTWLTKAVGSAYGHLTVIVVFYFLGYISFSEILACILSCSAPSPLAEQRCYKLELPFTIAKGFYYSKNQNL